MYIIFFFKLYINHKNKNILGCFLNYILIIKIKIYWVVFEIYILIIKIKIFWIVFEIYIINHKNKNILGCF
jgi:hypothetical protein